MAFISEQAERGVSGLEGHGEQGRGIVAAGSWSDGRS